MSITRHSLKWILLLPVLSLLTGLACTQKNPLDSTGSILGNQPNLVNLKADPTQVAVGGGISEIQVTLLNANDKPMAGGIVRFALSGDGRLDTTAAATNANGVARVNYLSGNKGTTSKVTATYQNSVKLIEIEVISASSGQAILLISSAKPALFANGEDSTAINIQMVPDENTEVENAVVYLSTDFGTIPSNVILDAEGKGQVVLMGSTAISDTSALVEATFGEMTGKTKVPVRAVSFQITSESDPFVLTLPADGKSTGKITASVNQKSSSRPIEGASILFTTESGEIQNQIVTEVSGKATVTLTSTPIPDTTMVRAWYGELMDSLQVIFFSNNVGDERSRIYSIEADEPEIWANPTYEDKITVTVIDSDGQPKDSATVYFSTSAGLLSSEQVLTDTTGQAVVYLSGYESDFDSTATITADLYNGTPSMEVSVLLKSESFLPKFIEIAFSPPSIGVIETGQVSTANVLATVRDAKYRTVGDNIRVYFDVIDEPGGGMEVTAQSDQGVPTVAGVAKITLKAGIKSGAVRMRARLLDDPLTDEDESLIEVESTKLIIHAGPPFMAERNDPNTSHLSVVPRRLNIWQGQDTTMISIIVGDKYHNPCDQGTAVYLTASGGVITTQSFTDQYGVAKDTLFAGSPASTVNRYHGYPLVLYDASVAQHNGARGPIPNWLGDINTVEDYGGDYMWNPNWNPQDPRSVQYIPSGSPDYEGSEVPNTNTRTFEDLNSWDLGENDGVSRVRASTIGMDAGGDSIYVWNWTAVIFSGYILDPMRLSDGTPLPTLSGAYLDGFRENSLEMIALRHEIKRAEYIARIGAQRRNYSVPAGVTNEQLFNEFFPEGCGHILFLGESLTFMIRIYDWNGNPIHCGAKVNASLASKAPLGLSWTTIENQAGTGTTFYDLTVSNTVNFEQPETGSAAVHIEVDYLGGNEAMDTQIFTAEDTKVNEYIQEQFFYGYSNF